jgi:hypothetical protein
LVGKECHCLRIKGAHTLTETTHNGDNLTYNI